MTELLAGMGAALWLGILTSISPCPLASNIAAVAFLSKKANSPVSVAIAGLAYTLGRAVAYATLGCIIIGSLLGVPQIALFLQKYMNKALGPILIVTGLMLMEVMNISLPGFALSEKQNNKLAGSGASGAFLLGYILAMAFCPVSAALFFGSLIPLALNAKEGVLLPFIYGAGTALPVLAFALIIAFGLTSLSLWFRKVTKFEYYMRKVTGAIFVIAGLYYTAVYVLKIF